MLSSNMNIYAHYVWPMDQLCMGNNDPARLFLNWFLEIVFVWEVGMYACLFVCVPT